MNQLRVTLPAGVSAGGAFSASGEERPATQHYFESSSPMEDRLGTLVSGTDPNQHAPLALTQPGLNLIPFIVRAENGTSVEFLLSRKVKVEAIGMEANGSQLPSLIRVRNAADAPLDWESIPVDRTTGKGYMGLDDHEEITLSDKHPASDFWSFTLHCNSPQHDSLHGVALYRMWLVVDGHVITSAPC